MDVKEFGLKMGVKGLWSLLTPFCDRRPLYELEGKTIAIDLAGWVCEALTVVDYSVQSRNYLRYVTDPYFAEFLHTQRGSEYTLVPIPILVCLQPVFLDVTSLFP